MANAKQAIFFLAFLPSVEGANSIISAAIEAGQANPDLFVIGAISDPMAMPNYVRADRDAGTPGETPYTFDKGGAHIVRAANVKDMVGDFEKEIPGLGHAIVHDKIVVIDPLSEDCVVAAGSHNLGFKASYENDENLIITKGAKALAQAYAVHVADVYEHYRFRAWQAEAAAAGRPTFDGHIQGDDKWLGDLMKPGRRGLDSYFG